MVGDAQLEIYYERNSDPALREEIWKEAEALGFSEQFIPVEKHSMLDDHTPFLEVGIPAVDIIDFDYPYWHTTGDTIDKVSPESLQAVGETLYYWLID
jgi:Zn-dependent M28 family amino/carboxypeptidase